MTNSHTSNLIYRSFLAGALPLSMSLSPSQLRLISSIGVGVLVGTSLIVIIPEGIEAAVSSSSPDAPHVRMRSLLKRVPVQWADEARSILNEAAATTIQTMDTQTNDIDIKETLERATAQDIARQSNHGPRDDGEKDHNGDHEDDEHHDHVDIPATEIGLSMILGFILMFLIDRLPRHATESLDSAEQTRHISMDNLDGADAASIDLEAEGFLGSLAPSKRHARSFATTIGLVIHAAADGIAMGASATTEDMQLGLVIFLAIMIHKAPAAFGLTSVLLKQGLSKRAARGHLILFSLAAPFGALTTWILVTILGGRHTGGASTVWWTGMLLLFSGGTFLYVTFTFPNLFSCLYLWSCIVVPVLTLADMSQCTPWKKPAPAHTRTHTALQQTQMDTSMDRLRNQRKRVLRCVTL